MTDASIRRRRVERGSRAGVERQYCAGVAMLVLAACGGPDRAPPIDPDVRREAGAVPSSDGGGSQTAKSNPLSPRILEPEIFELGGFGGLGNPILSANGATVVFGTSGTLGGRGRAQAAIVLATGELVRTTPDAAVDFEVNWEEAYDVSGDGTQVVYAFGVPMAPEVVLASYDGESRQTLFTESAVTRIDIDDAATLIAYRLVSGAIKIRSIDAPDTSTTLAEGTDNFTLSGDGKWVAYFSDVSLYVVPTDGGEPRLLVQTAGTKIPGKQRPAISETGAFVAYVSRNDEDKNVLYTVDLEGGEPVDIVHETNLIAALHYTLGDDVSVAGDRFVSYAAFGMSGLAEGWGLRVLDLESDEHTLWVGENVVLASVSRDGERAVYSIANDLFVAALDGDPIMTPVMN
jgi:hypothetical protein